MDDQAVWRRGAPVRFPSARWELTFSRALRRENGGRLELALPYSPARPWPHSRPTGLGTRPGS